MDSEWLITGIRETENGERMLLWQNQSSGLVAYWKLNEQAKLINSTRDEGWGYVSGTLVGSQWRLIGVSGSNTLLWQNQSAGKVVWWRINENGKLPNTTRDNGWGFVSETLTGPSWYLVDIANLSGTQTLFWHNQSSGQAAYWRLNESTKLTNTTRNDGWGLVSDVLTASGAWRMNCVTK